MVYSGVKPVETVVYSVVTLDFFIKEKRLSVRGGEIERIKGNKTEIKHGVMIERRKGAKKCYEGMIL